MRTTEEVKTDVLQTIADEVNGRTYETVMKLLDELAELAMDEGIEWARENPPREPDEY